MPHKRSSKSVPVRRAERTLGSAIADFLLDRESQNYSPKTLIGTKVH